MIGANNQAPPLKFSVSRAHACDCASPTPPTRGSWRSASKAPSRSIIALDGQPCEAFEPLRGAFPMAPGARFDMMFDMPRDGAGVRFILLGGASAAIAGEADAPVIAFGGEGEPVPDAPAARRAARQSAASREIDLQRAKRVDLTIAGGGDRAFSINGATAPGWPAKPLFSVRARRAGHARPHQQDRGSAGDSALRPLHAPAPPALMTAGSPIGATAS